MNLEVKLLWFASQKYEMLDATERWMEESLLVLKLEEEPQID